MVDKEARKVEQEGGQFLPCPMRKNHAKVSVEVCKHACDYAKKCEMFQAWLRPGLF